MNEDGQDRTVKRPWRNKALTALAASELHPVAKLHPIVDELEQLGVRFKPVTDGLGPARVAVVAAREHLYLLRVLDGDPVPGVAVHAATAGQPQAQLEVLVTALGLEPTAVHYTWDGGQWR